MKQILIVDNYDSFVYNLVQIVEKNGKCKYDIVKNDGISPDSVSEYDGILLSPGPGIPKEAGMLCPLIETSYATTPILGICLGHQAIAEVFGCRLTRLEKPLHGHISPLFIIDSEEILFRGIVREIVPSARQGGYVSEKEGRNRLQSLADSNFDSL